MRNRGSGGERRAVVTIGVYSKKGCGICEAAKEKLGRMGLRYETYDLQEMMDAHDGWRDDGSVEMLAAYASIGNRLPVIRIGEAFHDYPGAMRRLKTLRSEAEPRERRPEMVVH